MSRPSPESGSRPWSEVRSHRILKSLMSAWEATGYQVGGCSFYYYCYETSTPDSLNFLFVCAGLTYCDKIGSFHLGSIMSLPNEDASKNDTIVNGLNPGVVARAGVLPYKNDGGARPTF